MADGAPRKPPLTVDEPTADTTPERKTPPAAEDSDGSLFGQFDAMVEALLGPPPPASPREEADNG